MAFIRKKIINNKEYFYLVESFRIGNKTYQKNLKYLGNVMPKKEEQKKLFEKFNEKKVQQIIRNGLDFKPYQLSKKDLEKAEELKKRFYSNLEKLSKKGKEQLLKKFKTGYTYHSCSIEGNTLSKYQVDMIINKGESVGGKKLIEILEVQNHKKAIDYMLSEIGDISEDFIKRLHKVLTNGISDEIDDPDFVEGDYRKDQRYIEGADFIPTPPELIEDEMKDLIKFYKENKYKIHPIELASEFHLRFVIIHPFSDGNGRIARLLMNFILDRSNYPMIDISVKNREQYLKALDSGKSKNLSKFILKEFENYLNEIFN